MALVYLDYLLLDCFSTKEPIKMNSLYHILTGKRTVSVMLQALRYDLSPYYTIFPKLNRTYLEERVAFFEKKGWFVFQETGHLLTEQGKQEIETFFNAGHARLNNRAQLRYALILPRFRRRMLFLTQILSEVRHQNTHYLPLEERVAEQQWIKEFLKECGQPKDEIGEAFGLEWMKLLESEKLENPELFIEQFEGHNQSRKTAAQVGELYGMEEAEVWIRWHENWLELIVELEANPSIAPYMAQVLQSLVKRGGLCSISTQETYHLWVAGRTPLQIAEERRLKESTIYDHFTEMAVLYPTFPFEQFLMKEMILAVKDAHLQQEKLDYTSLQNRFPSISFFESRLMQIMDEVENL